MAATMEIKRNALGQRCDLKMTKSGKLACMGASCQRLSTHKVERQRNHYHPSNRDTLYVCERHIPTRGVITDETNVEGYIGRTEGGPAWYGTMRANHIVTWQEREKL